MKKYVIAIAIAMVLSTSTAMASWYNPMTWFGSDAEVTEVIEVSEVVIVNETVYDSENITESFNGKEGANIFPVQLECMREIAEKQYVCKKSVYVFVNGYTVTVEVKDKIKQTRWSNDTMGDFLSGK